MRHLKIGAAALSAVALLGVGSNSFATSSSHPVPGTVYANTDHNTSVTWSESPAFAGTVDLAAVTSATGQTLDQAKADMATTRGMSATPLTYSGVAGGVTYTAVSSSPMTLDSATVVTTPATKGAATVAGSIEENWSEISTGKLVQTSLPDPVAVYLKAFPKETRAQALAFYGSDPAARSGMALSDGTVIAATATTTPAMAASDPVPSGPLIQSACYDQVNKAVYWVHWHNCWRSYLVQSGSTWYVDEVFKASFSVDGWWRVPGETNAWMYHQPTGNTIVDWTPASTKASDFGCAAVGLGISGFSLTIPVCDGWISPNGPMMYAPAGHPAGPLFGVIWDSSTLAHAGAIYELNGVSMVKSSLARYGGKVYHFNAKWLG